MSESEEGRPPAEEILDATTGGRGVWCDGQKEMDRSRGER